MEAAADHANEIARIAQEYELYSGIDMDVGGVDVLQVPHSIIAEIIGD